MVVDGYIATSTAMGGDQVVLESLELEPLLSFDLRLGEGSGTAVVLPILDAALSLLGEMATFAEAGVAGARDVAASTAHPEMGYDSRRLPPLGSTGST